MSILSSPLGGVTLTGDDATAFLRQIEEGPPNDLAKPAMERGSDLLRQYQAKGVVTIILGKETNDAA